MVVRTHKPHMYGFERAGMHVCVNVRMHVFEYSCMLVHMHMHMT